MAGSTGGIVYQGAPYEGLTCDFLELLFAAGGTVLDRRRHEGRRSTRREYVKALQFMVDGIKNGDAPKAVTTYMEPESLAAFQTGKYAFMRNWPYAYALEQEGREGQGQVRRHAVPDFEGGGKAAHPRRPQQRRLGLLEEPGRRAEADHASSAPRRPRPRTPRAAASRR